MNNHYTIFKYVLLDNLKNIIDHTYTLINFLPLIFDKRTVLNIQNSSEINASKKKSVQIAVQVVV